MSSSPLFRTGAAYYPDYIPARSRIWSHELRDAGPRERMQADFERMKRAGLAWIRMGEFSWSTVEPRPGDFCPDVFVDALGLAEKNGIEVIFCTPTATPPPWLTRKLPEILPRDRSGHTIPPGTRRHYDPTNAAYREESRRITELYARAFGSHPAVRMWQTDNEFGCHGSTFVYTDSSRMFFQEWLQRKYKSIAALNEAWQTAFWSQGYSDFSEVPLPLRSYADPNPGLELDFRRAMNDAWRTFQAEQIELIRIHSPGRKITHNFMTLFFELDPWALSADLDTAGFDHYQMETEPHPVSSAWQFRLMASLKKRSFLVLEQQPVQVNWQKVNRRFSLHWLFLWGMQALFCGADSMLYFSWQRMYGGAEQYHDGIVPHDIRVEFSEQEELLAFQNRFLSALKAAGIEQMQAVCDVSIVLDFESVWSHEIAAQSEIFTTRRIADLVSDVCLSSGLGFSFARTIEQADPSARMLVLPSHAFELTNSEREFLASFVEKGGILLTLPRSLMKRRDNRMSELPLSVFSAADLKMLSYGALLESESETFVTNDGRKFHGLLWAERIEPGAGIEIIARFEGGLYAGAPAVMRQARGSGCWIHLAVVPEQNAGFYRWLLRAARIQAPVDAQGMQAFPLDTNRGRIFGVINPAARGDIRTEEKRTLLSAAAGQIQEKSARRKHSIPEGSVSLLL